MNELKEIETAVKQLSKDELAAFRGWFAKFDAQQWDKQIEEDVAAGRLDQLADQALEHLDRGQCTDL